jgi:serine/threonine protein kinase
MLGKFKELFGGNKKSGPPKKPRQSRVNLSRAFTILAEIGQGSMSKVYRATDKRTGRSVCLKVQLVEKNQAAAARAVQMQRPDEGEIGLKINHPNVVKTYEHGLSTKGEHFVVMEYIEGQSLRFIRETRSAPKLADTLDLRAQGAEGLAALHAAGFIHHDIGPHNFLVTRDPRV